MNRILFLIIVFCVIIADAQVHPDLIAIRQHYSPKEGLVVEFDLNIYWSVREKNEKKKGHLILKKGDKFRLKIDGTEWICDGYTYWQYSKTSNQVIVKNLLDIDLSQHPSQMISTWLNRNYKEIQKNEHSVTLVWEASNAELKKGYRKITLTIDRQKQILTGLVINDNDNNISTYVFKKTKHGEMISNKIFDFIVPKGVDLLDTRK